MNAEKPFIEQMSDLTKDARESVPNMNMKDARTGVGNAYQSIGDSMNGIKSGVKNTLGAFSSKSVMDASSEFLASNSLLAKLSFIIFVLIVFIMILKLMMNLIGNFMAPNPNPYLITGLLSGSNTSTITQDPSKDTTITILRSNDKNKGMEFTWSSWIFLNEPSQFDNIYHNIFVKGNNSYDANGISVTNGPGMYVNMVNDADSIHYNLFVVFDHIGGEPISSGDYGLGRDGIQVENIPINKWVHVAIRMQNMIMDIYVNGTIAKRHNMDKLPKQNSNDIIISGNNGFPGSISNLRYFSYALNVFEINNIVMGGPNTAPSKLSVGSQAAAVAGNYTYLSNSWYNAGYN